MHNLKRQTPIFNIKRNLDIYLILLYFVLGLILSSKLKEWLSILSRTRLSQILDMYYSSRGIAYDKSYKACQRRSKLFTLLNETFLIEQVQL